MAYLGYGSLIKQDDGGGTYITIPGVSNINEDGGNVDQVEITTSDSPDGYREFMSGLKTGGQVTFDMLDLPQDTQQKALRAKKDAGTTDSYKIVHSDGVTEGTFDAQVESMPRSLPTDSKATIRVALRITGPIVWTP
jgi:predicted secreted protein